MATRRIYAALVLEMEMETGLRHLKVAVVHAVKPVEMDLSKWTKVNKDR